MSSLQLWRVSWYDMISVIHEHRNLIIFSVFIKTCTEKSFRIPPDSTPQRSWVGRNARRARDECGLRDKCERNAGTFLCVHNCPSNDGFEFVTRRSLELQLRVCHCNCWLHESGAYEKIFRNRQHNICIWINLLENDYFDVFRFLKSSAWC